MNLDITDAEQQFAETFLNTETSENNPIKEFTKNLLTAETMAGDIGEPTTPPEPINQKVIDAEHIICQKSADCRNSVRKN